MKISTILVSLSIAAAASAIHDGSRHELRQFNGFGGNFGGFGNNGPFGNNNNGPGRGNSNTNNGPGRGNNNNNGPGQGNNNSGGQQGGNQGGNGGNQGGNNGGNQGGNNGANQGGNNGANQGGNNGANQGGNNGANQGGNNGANQGGNTGGNNNQDPQQSLTLDPKVIAQGFANDGQDVPADGQVASLTSTNNFINFCLTVPNLQITNGQQIVAGSCNPAPMGVLPSTDNMPSSKFVFPKNGDVIQENTAFTITMAIRNMQTGFFVNAQENYFSAPQQLNGQGQIQGHSHVVVELLSSIDQTTPTDPKKFAFFKGLNAAAVNGQLTADVSKGLPAGSYKLSSINSAANHQPVLVPIAQHGSLDDAVYFTITADGQPNADNAVLTGNANTGAGNTGAGNTGAGNTGAGNTGAGNTGAGNTGAGNTNNNNQTGAGNTNTNGGQRGNNGGQRGNNTNGGGNRNRRFARSRL